MNTPLLRLARHAGAFLALVAGLHAAPDYSHPYSFSTLAGAASVGSQDGSGANARFFSPRAAVVDAAGNTYIVDTGNHTIRKITPAGTVSTFAGLAGVFGSADGTGTAARFDTPQDIVADATGNLFVTDTGNQTIRKITPAGVVTTLAGSVKVAGKIDGLGATALFNGPLGIAIDPTGNLFVTEEGNKDIRKVTPAGAVSTLPPGFNFSDPYYYAVAADAAGSVYVAPLLFTDYDSIIVDGGWYLSVRQIGFLTRLSPDGTPTYLAQTTWVTEPPQYRSGPFVFTDILADRPDSVVLAGSRQVRRYSTTDFTFTAIAGSGAAGSGDGPAANAQFSDQFALASDPAGGFAVADAGNNTVRRISANGNVTTVAGLALERAEGTQDGAGAAARFAGATSVAVDASGNLYVADADHHCIRKVTAGGVVTTLAGAPGVSGFADGTGTAARFNTPSGVALSPSGNLYVTDTLNQAIRRVSPTGDVTTILGGADNPSPLALPHGIAVTASGTILIADTSNSVIRAINTDGTVLTPYGSIGQVGTVDGTGSSARFTQPTGLAVAPNGDIYVTEASQDPSVSRVRKITANGMVSTVAGVENGYADGPGAAARFSRPTAVAADANGNVFVVDTGNQLIRMISSAGAVSTIGGLVEAPGSSDGTGSNARFFDPRGIAIDSSGNLYIANGTTIRKGSQALPPTISAQPASQSVAAGGSVSFSVTANSLLPLSYQWSFNNSAISGATGSSLSLSGVRASDAGDYKVTITSDAGNVTSNAATLTVTTSTPPPAGGGGGGGGGGAPSWWFLSSLGAVAVFRALRICLRRGD